MKLVSIFRSSLRRLVPKFLHPTEILRRHLEPHRFANRIAIGPFRGMAVDSANPDVTLSYRLGAYEHELHPVLDGWRGVGFRTIFTGGAEHGYYAVGLARFWPEALVIAWEMDAYLRDRCGALARVNDCENRLQIRGMWTLDEFRDAALDSGQPVLVFMDVEGSERELLDPAVVPALRDAHIIVEVHDFIDRAVGDLLVKRFQCTHHIEEIWQSLGGDPRGRSRGFDWPRSRILRRLFFDRAYENLLAETRPERMRWFAMTPRATADLTKDCHGGEVVE